MRIRTKAWLFALLSGLVILVSLFAYFAANREIDRVEATVTTLGQIQEKAFMLQVLTGDYATRGTDRALTQWRLTHDRLESLMHNLAMDEATEAAATRVDEAHGAMIALFQELVTAVDPVSQAGADEGMSRELKQRLLGQLSASTQTFVGHVSRLRQTAESRAGQVRKLGESAILVCVLTLAAALLAISVWMDRRLVEPIAALHASTEAIGRGDLDHRASLTADDELGDLSRALDRMTSSLKSITASRDELGKEVQMRRLAEGRLQETLRELERSNKELEQFAYVASHDLQEPLRKIQSFGDLLETECRSELSDDAAMYVDRMRRASSRMQTLISDLLTLSRVTTRAKPFCRTDLNQVAETVVSDLQSRIDETGGAVSLAPLPCIEADAMQMGQLLQNLIGNALKFHKDGRGAHVRVFSEDASVAHIELHVADDGIGFDPKYSDRIFDVFQRLHGRGEYEGSGIGLAVCRRIAERHGGGVTVDSVPGEGSTFTVCLPKMHSATAREALYEVT